MPTTPLLGITQVSVSQANKEATINDGLEALENATNAKLSVSFAAATDILLSDLQATRNFIFVATDATADSVLRIPADINAAPFNRIFAVRNSSGFGLTVRFDGAPGAEVVIPDNQTRLLAALDGTDVTVAAEPQAAINFLALSDTPASFTGVQGKFLGVNVAEDALVFLDAATFPSYTDNAGKYLVVNATENGVEWVDLALVTSFASLTDTPGTYTGAGGKLAAVKPTEDGIEFIDLPEAEAVEFVTADQWRVVIVEPGSEDQVGLGEVEFLDVNGFDLATGGTANSGSFDVGREPELAFDDDLTAGAGWLSDPEFVGDEFIGYDFPAGVTPRSVRLTPIGGFPTYSPARVAIEYYNGTAWVQLGDRLAAPWMDGEAQTFKINGVPLSSVSDAPADGEIYGRQNNAWTPIEAGGGDASYPEFTNNAGKHLAVVATEDGVEWVEPAAGGADHVVLASQAEYDALDPKDPDTFYFIPGESGSLGSLPTWDFNYAADGAQYIRINEDMTISEQGTIGTGVVAYAKSTPARLAVDDQDWDAAASPVVLVAGEILRVTATGVAATYGVFLARTA